MHSTLDTYGACRSNAQSNNPILMVHLVLLAQQTAFVCLVEVLKWAIEEQQSSEHILHSLQISVSFSEAHSQRESSHNGTTCLPTYNPLTGLKEQYKMTIMREVIPAQWLRLL